VGDKVDYGIGLAYRPASLCRAWWAGTTTLCYCQLYPTSQGLRIGPLAFTFPWIEDYALCNMHTWKLRRMDEKGSSWVGMKKAARLSALGRRGRTGGLWAQWGPPWGSRPTRKKGGGGADLPSPPVGSCRRGFAWERRNLKILYTELLSPELFGNLSSSLF
jgi:hypothetical protein